MPPATKHATPPRIQRNIGIVPPDLDAIFLPRAPHQNARSHAIRDRTGVLSHVSDRFCALRLDLVSRTLTMPRRPKSWKGSCNLPAVIPFVKALYLCDGHLGFANKKTDL